MIRQKRDELLADGAGGAENSDFDGWHDNSTYYSGGPTPFITPGVLPRLLLRGPYPVYYSGGPTPDPDQQKSRRGVNRVGWSSARLSSGLTREHTRSDSGGLTGPLGLCLLLGPLSSLDGRVHLERQSIA